MYSVAFMPERREYVKSFSQHNTWTSLQLGNVQLQQRYTTRDEDYLLRLSEVSFSFWENDEDAIYDTL